MIDTSALPAHADRILVTRLDGLGDVVLGTMLLSGLHAKWPEAKITLIVRRQMIHVAAILPDWVEVVALPFDPRAAIADHQPIILGQLRELCRRWKPQLAVIAEFNRTWAGEILAAGCGAPRVLAFDGPTGLNFRHREIRAAVGIPAISDWQLVHADADDRESNKYIAFLDGLGLEGKSFSSCITIRAEDRVEAGELWRRAGVQAGRTVVFCPSSSDLLARSLDAGTWSRWMKHVSASHSIAMLGSREDAAALDEIEAVAPPGLQRVTMPMEKIGATAAFLDGAGAVIAMDTGPMHLAAALHRPTLGVFGGGHRAERFLPVGGRAAAVRMPIGCYGCDWHCPFDTRLCIREIPEASLLQASDAFLASRAENEDAFSPRIFDVAAPPHVASVLLGPMMRQHRRHLKLNHEMIEHHAYLAEIHASQSVQIEFAAAQIQTLYRENHERADGIGRLNDLMTQISAANASRDEAIEKINQTLAEMSRVNTVRDEAISIVTQRTARPPRKKWF